MKARPILILLSRLDTTAAPLDEVGWQRVRRNLKPRRSPAWVAVPLAFAATLAIWVAFPAAPEPDSGLKGTGTTQLELSAAARSPDGTIARVEDGATVAERAVLVFRYHSNVSGPAHLWMRRGQAEPRLLGIVELESGTHELTRSGDVVGVSLEGEVGDVAVWMTPGPDGKQSGPVESGLPAAHLSIHVSP